MSISLDTVVVETYRQILPQVAGLVTKAEEHCAAQGAGSETLTGACLAPDMWPFAKQVFECGHHSARAIAGVRAGIFGPELEPAPTDFTALRKEIEATQNGYVYAYALIALQYAHLDDRLTADDWKSFKARTFPEESDAFSLQMAQRIIAGALALLPHRRIVD